MPIAQITTPIANPVASGANFTDRFKAYPEVTHWWTTTSGMAYTDPVSGFTRIRARIGTLDLAASGVVNFANDGAYARSSYDGDNNDPFFSTALPRLNGWHSFISVRNLAVQGNARRDWSLDMANQGLGASPAGPRLSSLPRRNDGSPQSQLVLEYTTGPIDERMFGPRATIIGSRQQHFAAINFTTGETKQAYADDTPAAGTFTNWAAAHAAFTATWNLAVGAAKATEVFSGTQSGLMHVTGDILSATGNMPAIKALAREYFTTTTAG